MDSVVLTSAASAKVTARGDDGSVKDGLEMDLCGLSDVF